MKGKFEPAIKHGKVIYADREARDSPETAQTLKEVEAYLEKQGDRVVFAWASTSSVIVDSKQGRRIGAGTAQAAGNVMAAAVVATREQWESVQNESWANGNTGGKG